MTCVIPISPSSTAVAKLYVAEPFERSRTKSPIVPPGTAMSPRAASWMTTSAEGTRRRIVAGAPAARRRSASSTGSVLQRPS
jgi:hypothetical protein